MVLLFTFLCFTIFYSFYNQKIIVAFYFVGTEQGIAIKIKDFLVQYHQLSANEGDTVILWISFWAKPLVNNQTTALKDLFKKGSALQLLQ